MKMVCDHLDQNSFKKTTLHYSTQSNKIKVYLHKVFLTIENKMLSCWFHPYEPLDFHLNMF